MIVVSDTSPLSGLILIGELKLLQRVFNSIVVRRKVHDELMILRESGNDLSEYESEEWITIRDVSNRDTIRDLMHVLDPGEAEAIALVEELKADYLLIDEKVGRKIATKRGIKVVGVLGVFVEAKKLGLIPDVGTYLNRLRSEAGFWIDKDLESIVRKKAGE